MLNFSMPSLLFSAEIKGEKLLSEVPGIGLFWGSSCSCMGMGKSGEIDVGQKHVKL